MIDADSCPVKENIVEIGNKNSVEAIFIASFAHMKNDLIGAKWKFDDSSKEEVDFL
ncbi:hypothetical protein [Cytobacillus citreus]|uniref:hypothetical protein n=1 Tax=Cytobacillus citreus TaxID=2833586 RepID=UPI003084163F